MMRLRTYGGISLFATVAVVYHAFKSRGQFYPAMVFLSTSKISLVLLLNLGLVVMCSLWQLTKRIFLGSLREAEIERLNEQSWREVMEILFAITIFRQDFSVTFLTLVTALLLIKALHWLAQKRVEYIETTPSVAFLSHVRIVSFLGFLFLIDSLFLYKSVKYLIDTRQPSVSFFFSFEYMILATTTISTFVKYVFYVSDMLMEGQWERKPVYTFYLELIRDLVHLSIYLCFFFVIFMHYGVPLHLIRELYETFRNFKIRIADYIRYQKIASNMNDRFPDATPEELNASDATCIICREEMTSAKKLICGHLFHVHCLRSWLERQHTCPTCRALVVPPESSSSAQVGQGNRQHTNSHVTSSSSSSDASGGSVANNGLSQHRARLQAATAAACVYGKSIAYKSSMTWSPAVLYHSRSSDDFSIVESSGEQARTTGSSNMSPMQLSNGFFVPFETLNFSGGESVALGSISDLETQKRYLQKQIEVLKMELQNLQQLKADSQFGSPRSSECKGKSPA